MLCPFVQMGFPESCSDHPVHMYNSLLRVSKKRQVPTARGSEKVPVKNPWSVIQCGLMFHWDGWLDCDCLICLDILYGFCLVLNFVRLVANPRGLGQKAVLDCSIRRSGSRPPVSLFGSSVPATKNWRASHEFYGFMSLGS